jgi:hypothetical protein
MLFHVQFEKAVRSSNPRQGTRLQFVTATNDGTGVSTGLGVGWP